MSKSLGNIYLVQDLIDKGFSPLSYKMMCFSSHYRNKLNFTWESLESAQNSLYKLKEGFRKHNNGSEIIEESEIEEYRNKFLEAINDDLNMPIAMSVIWDVVKNSKKSKQFAELLLDFDKVLGIDIDKEDKKTNEIPEEITKLIEQRNQARENKDWVMSDKIRDEIKDKGYIIKDTKEGIIVEKV